MPRTEVALLDDLLAPHAAALGNEFAAYRNHAFRVLNFCAAFGLNDPDAFPKMIIASAFHDLGIWTDRTWDYLPPSEGLARAFLARSGKAEWTTEVTAMIHEHHKLTPPATDPTGLVGAFRKADLVDVSRGVFAFGLPRTFLREVFSEFPNEGFHKGLVRRTFEWFPSHPLNPLPMFHF